MACERAIDASRVPSSRSSCVPRLQAASIEAKIKKICDAFRARVYGLPNMDDPMSVQKLMNDNYAEMMEARVVLVKARTLPLCS